MSKSEFYAYPDADPGIEAVMRFSAVKRWHMIDTTRTQTLADHSGTVALLAYYIARTCPGMYFGPAQAVGIYGLLHDVPEVFTGDIPSHTKRHITGIDELEHNLLPVGLMCEGSEEVKHLVKMCDLVDGIRFIVCHGVDATATHAGEGLECQARQLWSRLEWPPEVMDHVDNCLSVYVTGEGNEQAGVGIPKGSDKDDVGTLVADDSY